MRLLLTCIAIILIGDLIGQPLHVKTYSTADGMSSVKCFHMWEMDRKTYIVTREGISQWDGYRWHHISSSESHTSYHSSAPYALRDNAWLLITQTDKSVLYKNGIWTSIKHPNGGKQFGYGRIYKDSTFSTIDTIGQVWLLNTDSIVLNLVDTIEIQKFSSDKFGGIFIRDSFLSHYYLDENNRPYVITKSPFSNNHYDKREFIILNSDYGFLLVSKKGGSRYIEKKDQKIDISGIQLPKIVDGRDRVIYVGRPGEEDLLLTDVDNSEESIFYLISQDTIQRIGTYNPTSLDKSLFFNHDNVCWHPSHEGLKRIDLNQYYWSNGHAQMSSIIQSIVEDENGIIWIGGYGSGSSYYKDNKLHKYNGGTERFLPGSHLYKDGYVYGFREETPNLSRLRKGRWEGLDIYLDGKLETNGAGYIIKTLNDKRLALGFQNHGLGIVDSISSNSIHAHTINEAHGMMLGNVLCIAQDQSNRIWMGRTGVSIYDESQNKATTFGSDVDDPSTFSCTSIICDDRGTLWFGTNQGLFYLRNAHLFSPTEDDFFKMVQQLPLPNGEVETMTSLAITTDNTLIIGSYESVSFMPLDDFYNNPSRSPYVYQLFYGEDISGGGTEQNAIIQDSKGYVWIGSQEGVTRLDITGLMWDTLPNKINIISCATGKGELQLVDHTYTVPTDSRNFILDYGPDYNPSLRKSTFYGRYLINSVGDTLQSSQYDQDGHLELNYLVPEEYEVHIIAKKHNQIIDKRVLKIDVPMSLSENPFFWGGLGLGFASLLGGFLLFRSQQQKKIIEKDLRFAELNNEKDKQQIQVIISSFNPHFINNSLHWAQSRYNRDESFVRVVGRLSANIRYLFKQTNIGKSYHTLKEEIQIVDNYLTIQKERFDDEPYQFNLPSELELEPFKDFKVFLMQIQILVENAIEHGLRHKEGNGYINVTITEDTNNLIISILDNGIGREAASKIGSKGTQQGLQMLASLRDIYNSKNKKPITLEYTDLPLTEDGIMCGTRVIVTIPKNYKYAF